MTANFGKSFWLGVAALAMLQGCTFSAGQIADDTDAVLAYAQLDGLPQLPPSNAAEPPKKEPPKKASRPRPKAAAQLANVQPQPNQQPANQQQADEQQAKEAAVARKEVPEPEPMNLIGLDEHQLMALLGAPTEQEAPTPGKIWRYRRAACTLDVALFPDVATRTYRSLAYEVTSDDNTPEGKQACVSQRHVYAGGQ